MQTLQVRRRYTDAEDAHGNVSTGYEPAEDWSVYGLAPGSMRELPAENVSVVVWTVLAPASDATPTVDDLVLVDGEEFEVNSEPQDWTRGPWPHPTAGVVVELRRAE